MYEGKNVKAWALGYMNLSFCNVEYLQYICKSKV